MKQHKPGKIVSSAYHSPVALFKILNNTIRVYNMYGERAAGVSGPSVDIWDGGRETREGNTSGQGLGQLKRLKKEEETEGLA